MTKRYYSLFLLAPMSLYSADNTIERLKSNGVIFQERMIDPEVQIGEGTKIGPGVQILGQSVIGKNCTIAMGCVITDCIIGDNVKILPNSVLTKSTVEDKAEVGPSAHIQESIIKALAIIGNFVEVKRSTVGPESKAKHLAYLGDATLGKKVNIGAGTITCNYDGVNKHPTIIEDEAFIGSNSTLVAPLHIGKGAMTAAGSTIVKNVLAGCLAIARTAQTNKDGYVAKLFARFREKKDKEASSSH